MERRPLDKQEVKTMLEQGYNAADIGERFGYAKRTVNEFIQKHGVRADTHLPPAHFVRPSAQHTRERAGGGEAEYYLRKRIQDLEGVLENQRDEIGELKEDNRELTRERNKLARDLELAEERKQLDLQKLTLEHSYKSKNTLSGIVDAVSSNDKLGEVVVLLANKILGGQPAGHPQQQVSGADNIFSSAAAGIISKCDQQKQAMLATVVEALASPENDQTLQELFALATGQNQQENGHQNHN
jgi:hypothetical protein